MREHANPGKPPPDEVTVHLPDGFRPPAVPEGVTVALPGAVLAPAPTPDTAAMAEAPVFVDDSGGRKRLLRIVGVLVALLSLSFLAVVGVALAVPSVATSVGLGNLMPFMVPGAAARPAKPAPAPAPVVAPKPVVAATTTATKPKVKAKPVITATLEATATVPATMTASATVTAAPVVGSVAPTTAAVPPSADPPVVEPAAVDANQADPAVPN